MNKKKLTKKLRNKADKEWRLAILKEFDSKCVVCDKKDRVNCHHLFPKEIKELRHEVLNGICLCVSHHKYNVKLSAHKNPVAFLLWYQGHYTFRFVKLLESWKKV